MILEAIRGVRRWKGFSQQDIADCLGVTVGTYGRMERGNMNLYTFLEVCDYLGTTPEVVIEWMRRLEKRNGLV